MCCVALKENYKCNSDNNKRASCWAFFKLETNSVNKRTAVCIECKRLNLDGGVYTLGPNSGTNNLQKHVEKEHLEELQEFLQQQANEAQADGDDNKRKRFRGGQLISKARAVQYYSADSPKQMEFNFRLGIMIAKSHLPFRFCEDDNFRSLIEFLDPKLKVPSRKHMTNTILPEISSQTMNDYVQPILKRSSSGVLGVDLWMNIAVDDVFGLIWHCVDDDFCFHEICLGLVGTVDTRGEYLKEELMKKLQHFGLLDRVTGIIKDGGANLNTCTSSLAPLISNRLFDFVFTVPCLAHLLSSACSNAVKVDCAIKNAKQIISKCITYTKKVRSICEVENNSVFVPSVGKESSCYSRLRERQEARNANW